jgi:hypothetical protein
MGGLSTSDPDQSYDTMAFGIAPLSNGNVAIYEGNSLIGLFGTYIANDVFRVEISAGSVYFKKNGAILYTSLSSPSYPCFFDSSLYNQGASLTEIQMLSSALYLGSKVDLPAFSYTGIGTIQAVETSSVSEVGTPRYIIGGKYYNGSAWVNSNGSYAQANPFATVVANLTSLVVTGATSVPVGC